MSTVLASVILIAWAIPTATEQAQEEKRQIQNLIEQLGADLPETREKAADRLQKIGKPALSALRKAAKSSDPEVRTLAARTVERINWSGLEKLKEYVRENYADGTKVERSGKKALVQWFPKTRFYEAKEPMAGNPGAAAMFQMQGGKVRSLFAVAGDEDGFSRLLVKGVFCSECFQGLIKKHRIVIDNHDKALDFAMAFLDVFGSTGMMQTVMAAMGGMARLEKTDEGWKLLGGSYGMSILFRTNGEGMLLEIRTTPLNYLQQMGLGGALGGQSEEKSRLEIQKLKLELELLKRAVEKGR